MNKQMILILGFAYTMTESISGVLHAVNCIIPAIHACGKRLKTLVEPYSSPVSKDSPARQVGCVRPQIGFASP
ncbi:hypothetical protein QBC34DRAFT_413289 [Podospora aff. communis PSN243]|uniref:Secreted protein n=1 Tax=Podospora aff. communis PSN243 TaxID=3040156 RepID=A0AAV9GEG2_9PEZI|nr:hypothetical protein QBC34DRAFT_413289 [Podospora aff. communis PSN243]